MENAPEEKPRRYWNVAETFRRIMAKPPQDPQIRYAAGKLAEWAIAELPLDVLAEWFTKLADGLASELPEAEVSGKRRPQTGVSEMTMAVEESPELRTARIEIRSLEAELAKQVDEVAHAQAGERAAMENLERLRAIGVPGRVREQYFGRAARMLVHHIVDDLDDEQLVKWCERIPSTYSGKPDMCTLADVCWGPRDGRAPGNVCGGRDPNDEDED